MIKATRITMIKWNLTCTTTSWKVVRLLKAFGWKVKLSILGELL